MSVKETVSPRPSKMCVAPVAGQTVTAWLVESLVTHIRPWARLTVAARREMPRFFGPGLGRAHSDIASGPPAHDD